MHELFLQFKNFQVTQDISLFFIQYHLGVGFLASREGEEWRISQEETFCKIVATNRTQLLENREWLKQRAEMENDQVFKSQEILRTV